MVPYINTRQNPEDQISRWLRESSDKWPNFNFEITETMPDLKRVKVNTTVSKPHFELFDRYSSSLKLRRVVAYILRFIKNIRIRIRNK